MIFRFGSFCHSDSFSGGSQSNLTAVFLARDWFCREKLGWDIRKHGLPDSYRKLRLYTSEISHFFMEKSAHLPGLGYDAVVKVPVDSAQKMDVSALRKLVDKDIAEGNLPFCVAAAEGTTDYGSIDPIPALRPICEKFGIRLHADAADGIQFFCRSSGIFAEFFLHNSNRKLIQNCSMENALPSSVERFQRDISQQILITAQQIRTSSKFSGIIFPAPLFFLKYLL